jgi:hypothetical protein
LDECAEFQFRQLSTLIEWKAMILDRFPNRKGWPLIELEVQIIGE